MSTPLLEMATVLPNTFDALRSGKDETLNCRWESEVMTRIWSAGWMDEAYPELICFLHTQYPMMGTCGQMSTRGWWIAESTGDYGWQHEIPRESCLRSLIVKAESFIIAGPYQERGLDTMSLPQAF